MNPVKNEDQSFPFLNLPDDVRVATETFCSLKDLIALSRTCQALRKSWAFSQDTRPQTKPIYRLYQPVSFRITQTGKPLLCLKSHSLELRTLSVLLDPEDVDIKCQDLFQETILGNLIKLDLYTDHLDSIDFDPSVLLPHLKNLRELFLSGVYSKQDGLYPQQDHLEPQQDRNFVQQLLKNAPNLKSLSLHRIISRIDLSDLPSRITKLDVFNCTMGNNELSRYMDSWSNLTDLSLGSIDISEDEINRLTQCCTKLQRFSLVIKSLTNGGIKAISTLQSLSSLVIRVSDAEAVSAEAIVGLSANLRSLTQLSLEGFTKLKDEDILSLAENLPNLQYLDLTCNNADDSEAKEEEVITLAPEALIRIHPNLIQACLNNRLAERSKNLS